MSVNGSLDSNNFVAASTLINNPNALQLLNTALPNLLDNNNLLNTQQKFNSSNQSSNSNTSNQSTSIPLSLSQQQQLQQQLQRQQNLINNFKSDNNAIGLNGSGAGLSQTTQSSGLIDLEKEKLKQDLIKQTEMSNKLETLCLQYRQWVEKLTIDLNELKTKYIRSESEKKNLELQLFNKLSIEQTIASNRNFNLNCSNISNSNSNSTNNMNTINSNINQLTNLTNTNNNANLNNLSNKK